MPSDFKFPRFQVLHVDDDPLNLRVVADVLSAFGHESFGVSSGPAGLDALGRQVFDLVLMDIHMPGMSGVDVVDRLRRSVGPERRTPVIALTADSHSRSRQDYIELGFQDFVTKPVLVSQLIGCVNRIVAQAARANERRLRSA